MRRLARRLPRRIVVALVVAIAIVAVSFTLGVYRVSGDSMRPTLVPGELVLVERLGPPPGGYALGDLIAFEAPAGWETSEPVLVKRLIGLPNDVITIYEGQVHRNGLLLDEPYLTPTTGTTLRGRLIGEWLVRPGQYFLLGDNRSPSLDSRLFGPVDATRIIGRVILPTVDRAAARAEAPAAP